MDSVTSTITTATPFGSNYNSRAVVEGMGEICLVPKTKRTTQTVPIDTRVEEEALACLQPHKHTEVVEAMSASHLPPPIVPPPQFRDDSPLNDNRMAAMQVSEDDDKNGDALTNQGNFLLTEENDEENGGTRKEDVVAASTPNKLLDKHGNTDDENEYDDVDNNANLFHIVVSREKNKGRSYKSNKRLLKQLESYNNDKKEGHKAKKLRK
jgi:hypothetical protein